MAEQWKRWAPDGSGASLLDYLAAIVLGVSYSGPTLRLLQNEIPREDTLCSSTPRPGARLIRISLLNGESCVSNLSGLPTWLSDALCRLASGGSFAVRQLYSDDDEVLFHAARPASFGPRQSLDMDESLQLHGGLKPSSGETRRRDSAPAHRPHCACRAVLPRHNKWSRQAPTSCLMFPRFR